jgi:hypothetical protein
MPSIDLAARLPERCLALASFWRHLADGADTESETDSANTFRALSEFINSSGIVHLGRRQELEIDLSDFSVDQTEEAGWTRE